jgi:peroxiredoxin
MENRMPPRPTYAPIVATAALSLLAISCGGGGGEGAADASGKHHPLIGKPAPELNAEAVGGDGPKTLKAAQGKVVILDFWGTFCEPCKKSFPKYQELADQFPGDVAILAVSVDEPENVKKEQLMTFAKDNHAKFAIVWDKEHSAAEKYGLAALTIPSSFVIDKNGTVRHLHVGFHDGEDGDVAGELLDDLLVLGERFLAGLAEGAPEVEDDHLALRRLERLGPVAGDVLRLEVGGGRADERALRPGGVGGSAAAA